MNILMSISSFNPQTVFLRVSTTICTQHNTEIPHNIVLAVGSLNLLNVNSCFNKEGGGGGLHLISSVTGPLGFKGREVDHSGVKLDSRCE